jgi:hypothetical protein
MSSKLFVLGEDSNVVVPRLALRSLAHISAHGTILMSLLSTSFSPSLSLPPLTSHFFSLCPLTPLDLSVAGSLAISFSCIAFSVFHIVHDVELHVFLSAQIGFLTPLRRDSCSRLFHSFAWAVDRKAGLGFLRIVRLRSKT